jgi:hypothetical protein
MYKVQSQTVVQLTVLFALHCCYCLLTVWERKTSVKKFLFHEWRPSSSDWARKIHECHLLYTSAICQSTLDWGRGIQEITTYQLWGVCVRKVCVVPVPYCEEVFRFKPWRSYQSFCFLEGTSVKAFILQTCCVQDHVAECSMTENCYLVLKVQGREQEISEDKVTALWVLTLCSDVGYLPHCYLVLQCRRLWLENSSTWKPWISHQWRTSFLRGAFSMKCPGNPPATWQLCEIPVLDVCISSNGC